MAESYSSMPTVPNYSLSNNITGNPACLQSNASSYSCMLPDMLEWYKEGLNRLKTDSDINVEPEAGEMFGNMLETSRAWQDYVSGTARSYDPLSLSNYSRSSCNPAAGMQSHMPPHSTNGASTGLISPGVSVPIQVPGGGPQDMSTHHMSSMASQ